MSAANRDLVDYIDIHRVKALNITAESNPEFLFGKYLNVIESRADPQIILIPFKEPVKLFSVSFEAPNDESAPTEVALYANVTDVSFSDVDSLVPTECFSLSEEDVNPITSNKLKPLKWNNITSVVVFIKENRGSFSTCLGKIRFFGKPTHALTSVDGITKQDHH
ncbi:hypothetical protein WA577_004879 [Blastocystis sp. JDR]